MFKRVSLKGRARSVVLIAVVVLTTLAHRRSPARMR